MFSSLLSMSGFESINTKKNSHKNESISSVSSNTLKTMSSFRTLPLIKSKSLNNWFSNQNKRSNEPTVPSQVANGRRLSWLERRTWSFRKGNKRNVKGMECWPDITIIFSKDAFEWDEYLTECFAQMNESHPLTIIHERIDQINFPLANCEAQNFCNSRAILLILSPDLLDFIDENADVFELTRLLNPKRTVVMLCGVQQQDISRFHKAALATYDQWKCLVAKDQDKEFVLSVIQTVLQIIEQNESLCSNKSQFKLTPRKVREGSGKVFILLDNPIGQKQQIDILFDGINDNQVTVKWKNPYNVYFTIPDDMLRVARVMNISLICDNKNFLGMRPLKCETKMSELHSLLASVNSPIEFMCQSLGYATLSQLDTELTNRFDHKMTNFGSLFHKDIDITTNKKSSECYLPTLLHFAAAYGLRELTSKLLHCPLALKACQTRNSDNLTPAQMAHHLKHRDIGALLNDFERLSQTQKPNLIYGIRRSDGSELTDQQKADLERNVATFRYSNTTLSSAHHQLYGLRLYSDLLDLKQCEEFGLKNSNNNKSRDESKKSNIMSKEYEEEYDKQELINEIHFKNMTKRQSISDSDSSDSESSVAIDLQTESQSSDKNLIKIVNNFEDKLTNDFTIKTKNTIDFNDIQQELMDIINVFKEGISFDKFETLFDKWQKKYCNVLDANESEELHESLTQIKTLCEIGRKHKELENNKNSLNFNDLRYYLSSKLDNKLNDNNLKQTLHERLRLLSLNQLFCSQSLSSISSTSSSSSTTTGNPIDGNNQSTKSVKSSFERNRVNRRYNQNNYYKRLKTKVISLVDKQSGSQVNDKQSDSTQKAITNTKPPAPPPRPLTVDSISKPNKTNESIEKTTNHSLYYNYQNNKKVNIDFGSDETLTQLFDQKECHPSADNYSNMSSKTSLKRNSLSEPISNVYVNMNSKQMESPKVVKRDPLIDYDFVPSGIPVPINSHRAKAILSIKPLNNSPEFDYDIPKVPKRRQIKGKERKESTIETELQIFV